MELRRGQPQEATKERDAAAAPRARHVKASLVAEMDALGLERLAAVKPRLAELALGGTAVGTGLNAPPGFAERVIGEALVAVGSGEAERRAAERAARQNAQARDEVDLGVLGLPFLDLASSREAVDAATRKRLQRTLGRLAAAEQKADWDAFMKRAKERFKEKGL